MSRLPLVNALAANVIKRIQVLIKPYIVLPSVTLLLVFGWSQLKAYRLSFDKPGGNLLPNASFESFDEKGLPRDWAISAKQATAATSVEKVKGYVDGSGLRINIMGYESGNISLETAKIPVQAGETYHFKSYYLSDISHDLLVRTYFHDGSTQLTHLKHYPDLDYPWSTMAGTVVAPAAAKEVSFVVTLSSNGFMELDGAYVVKAEVPGQELGCMSEQNLLTNSSFSSVKAGAPAGWQSERMGEVTATNKFVQGKPSRLRSEVSAVSDGLVKWSHKPIKTQAFDRHCIRLEYRSNTEAELIAEYILADGTSDYVYIGNLRPSDEWAVFAGYLEAPKNATMVTVALELTERGYAESKGYHLAKVGSGGAFDKSRLSITFDDGWLSSYQNTQALLQKHGLKATFYVSPGLLGQAGYMRHADLEAVATAGHQIASHGNSHIDISAFNERRVSTDLSAAHAYLRSTLSLDHIDFASPYGKNDHTALPIIKQLYASHRGTESGHNTKQNFELYNLRVFFVRRETTATEIREAIREAEKYNAWLILVYHQVESIEDSFAVSESTFAAHMQEVLGSGIAVQTVRDALHEIEPQF